MSKSDIFKTSSTQYTPKVTLDASSNEFSITGNSMPENSEAFYVPMLEWTKDFKANIEEGREVSVTVKLNYYNSSSMRYLVDWFSILSEINAAKNTVHVNWYYEEGDDLMEESGVELSSLVNLSFKIKEIE